MKQTILAALAIVILASCNNNAEKKEVKTDSLASTPVAAETPKVQYPYTATYSSDFSMGNPEYTRVVLEMYKALEENRIDDIGQYLEDTVHRYNYAAVHYNLPKADMLEQLKKFRGQFKEFSETPIAFMAVKSNDKNEDWVLTWVKEKVVFKNGKVDSTTYQENWRFKDGKIYMHDSYAKFRQ